MGCPNAVNHNFFLWDVNNDGFVDIGIERETFTCILRFEQTDEFDRISGPFYRKSAIEWYIFCPELFRYRKAQIVHDEDLSMIRLPLIEMVKDPVSYVIEIHKSDERTVH